MLEAIESKEEFSRDVVQKVYSGLSGIFQKAFRSDIEETVNSQVSKLSGSRLPHSGAGDGNTLHPWPIDDKEGRIRGVTFGQSSLSQNSNPNFPSPQGHHITSTSQMGQNLTIDPFVKKNKNMDNSSDDEDVFKSPPRQVVPKEITTDGQVQHYQTNPNTPKQQTFEITTPQEVVQGDQGEGTQSARRDIQNTDNQVGREKGQTTMENSHQDPRQLANTNQYQITVNSDLQGEMTPQKLTPMPSSDNLASNQHEDSSKNPGSFNDQQNQPVMMQSVKVKQSDSNQNQNSWNDVPIPQESSVDVKDSQQSRENQKSADVKGNENPDQIMNKKQDEFGGFENEFAFKKPATNKAPEGNVSFKKKEKKAEVSALGVGGDFGNFFGNTEENKPTQPAIVKTTQNEANVRQPVVDSQVKQDDKGDPFSHSFHESRSINDMSKYHSVWEFDDVPVDNSISRILPTDLDKSQVKTTKPEPRTEKGNDLKVDSQKQKENGPQDQTKANEPVKNYPEMTNTQPEQPQKQQTNTNQIQTPAPQPNPLPSSGSDINQQGGVQKSSEVYNNPNQNIDTTSKPDPAAVDQFSNFFNNNESKNDWQVSKNQTPNIPAKESPGFDFANFDFGVAAVRKEPNNNQAHSDFFENTNKTPPPKVENQAPVINQNLQSNDKVESNAGKRVENPVIMLPIPNIVESFEPKNNIQGDNLSKDLSLIREVDESRFGTPHGNNMNKIDHSFKTTNQQPFGNTLELSPIEDTRKVHNKESQSIPKNFADANQNSTEAVHRSGQPQQNQTSEPVKKQESEEKKQNESNIQNNSGRIEPSMDWILTENQNIQPLQSIPQKFTEWDSKAKPQNEASIQPQRVNEETEDPFASNLNDTSNSLLAFPQFDQIGGHSNSQTGQTAITNNSNAQLNPSTETQPKHQGKNADLPQINNIDHESHIFKPAETPKSSPSNFQEFTSTTTNINLNQSKMVEQTGHQPTGGQTKERQQVPAPEGPRNVVSSPSLQEQKNPQPPQAAPEVKQSVKPETGTGNEDFFNFDIPVKQAQKENPVHLTANIQNQPEPNNPGDNSGISPSHAEDKGLSESFFDVMEFSKDLDLSSVIPSNNYQTNPSQQTQQNAVQKPEEPTTNDFL